MIALLIAFALCCEGPEPSDPKIQPPNELALSEVLQKWEKATAGTTKLKSEFNYFQYNAIFNIEKRGKGTLSYTAPDEAVFRTESISVKGLRAKRGWRLDAFRADLFEWKGSEVRWGPLDSEEEPAKIQLPLPPGEHFFIPDWIQTPGGFLQPFLVEFDPAAMQTHYNVRITRQDERELWLEFEPLTSPQRLNYSRLDWILDARSFEPKAARMIEPGAGDSHVFVFEQIKRN